jgi:hypothetical protein
MLKSPEENDMDEESAYSALIMIIEPYKKRIQIITIWGREIISLPQGITRAAEFIRGACSL